MKGLNTLKLNQDTMREAVQYWLDDIFEGAVPKVTNVKSSSNYSSGEEFEVTLVSENVAE